MNEEREKVLLRTLELMAARTATCELMLRALFQTHPYREMARDYFESMLGQALAQPSFVTRPEYAEAARETAKLLTELAPPKLPGG